MKSACLSARLKVYVSCFMLPSQQVFPKAVPALLNYRNFKATWDCRFQLRFFFFFFNVNYDEKITLKSQCYHQHIFCV